MDAIRVLHLITALDTGGAEMMLYKLLASLDKRLFNWRVVCLSQAGSIGEKIEALGISVDYLQMAPGRISARPLVNLLRKVRDFAPDIIQTWLYHADLAGLLAAGVTGRGKVVWNVRSIPQAFAAYKPSTRWVTRLCGLLSPLPAAVIVNSQHARQRLPAYGYRPRRFVVIPNGFDLNHFRFDAAARHGVRRELGLGPDNCAVGMVARYDAVKDFPNFLHAACGVAAAYADCRFICCGAGVTKANDRLVEMAGRLGIGAKVSFVGRRDDIAGFMNAMDVVVLSSYVEDFPNVVGEAMACEVPCVVTDVGDAPQIVGLWGRVVPPRDPRALGAAIEELVEMGTAQRRVLGRKARERIRRYYDINRISHCYGRLYRELGQGIGSHN